MNGLLRPARDVEASARLRALTSGAGVLACPRAAAGTTGPFGVARRVAEAEGDDEDAEKEVIAKLADAIGAA
jgi:hypothetical protein